MDKIKRTGAKILIVTMPRDGHSDAVAWALGELGIQCDILYPFDLADGAIWHWLPNERRLNVRYKDSNRVYDLPGYTSAWLPNTPTHYPLPGISDPTERSIAEAELSVLTTAVYHTISASCPTLDPFTNIRKSKYKPWQLTVAMESGFKCPPTIFSCDRNQIFDFAERLSWQLVYKPLGPAVEDRATFQSPKIGIGSTTKISREIFKEAKLFESPGIFQKYIEKKSEIRAVKFGDQIRSWEIKFDQPQERINRRHELEEPIYASCNLPAEVKGSCLKMMERLGLKFGCFDIAIEASTNDYLFLGLNPQSQWLYGDHSVPDLEQLSLMTYLLAYGGIPSNGNRRHDLTVQRYQASCDLFCLSQKDVEHFGSLESYNYLRLTFPAKLRYAVHSNQENMFVREWKNPETG